MSDFYEYGNPRFDGKHLDDCYIRAVIFATKTNYEYVQSLYENKQQTLLADLPNRPQVVDAVMADLGYQYVDMVNPSTGRGRMKIASFLKKNKKAYILKAKAHLCYAENGKVIDIWDCSNCLLIGYWTIS